MMMNTTDSVCFFLARELVSAVETHNALALLRFEARRLLNEARDDLTPYGEIFLKDVERGEPEDLLTWAVEGPRGVLAGSIFKADSPVMWVQKRRVMALHRVVEHLTFLRPLLAKTLAPNC